MATDVLIEVKSLQRQGEQQNIISYETRGYLYQKGQATYLQYSEGAEGLEGVQTTLKLEKDRVTLIRHGEISMRQFFVAGSKDGGLYETPYGSLELESLTHTVKMAIGYDEGRLRLTYDLYLGGEFSSQNTLEITYQSIIDEEH